jgi:mycothiol synthase
LRVVACRPYSDARDLPRIADLLCAVRPAQRITDYPSAADLHELLCSRTIQASTRLWFDEQDRLAAFALVDSSDNIWFEHREFDPDTQLELVKWGLECMERRPHFPDVPQTLDTSCGEDDVDRIALLKHHGFLRQANRTVRRSRDLRLGIPLPALPSGFEIRALRGRHEVEPWVQLHRAAFGTQHMTIEERRAMMDGPDYEPQLDLVAVDADDRLVAYCMCWIRRDENARTGRSEGHTDPVATHPDYQGRGLAKVLLFRGLRMLQDRGVSIAVMGTDSANERMQRVALVVGFSVESSRIWYSKPVMRPAP